MNATPLRSIRRVVLALLATFGVFALQYVSISNTPSPLWMGGGCPYGVLFSYFPVHEWRLSLLDHLNPILGFPFDSILRRAQWHTTGHWTHDVMRVVCPLPWDDLECIRLNYLILAGWNTASWVFAIVSVAAIRGLRQRGPRPQPRLA